MTIADGIETAIRAGDLHPGHRLPPQRRFAYQRGIAASTAGRVYRELVRRGLVTGEIGRGTYVRDPAIMDRTLLDVADVPVDLAVNYPVVAGQAARMAPALARLARPDRLDRAMRFASPGGDALERDRRTALAFLGADAGRSVLFTGSGRQAIGCAIDALVPQGGALAVEEWTYPIALKLAARLGRRVVPVAMDADGLRPDALADAHARTAVSALYVQPTIHNPTTVTMPEARRSALAATADRLGIAIIEDRAYGFLSTAGLPDLASLAPDVVMIDSLSKRLSPGLSVGMLTMPDMLQGRLTQSALEMGWIAGTYAIRAAADWMRDGTLDAVAAEKRADAVARRAIVATVFDGMASPVACDGYHAWLRLPEGRESLIVQTTLAARGIAITTGAPYAARRQPSFEAVRIALSRVEPARLPDALRGVRMVVDGEGD